MSKKLIARECIVCRGTKHVIRIDNGPLGMDINRKPELCPFCNGEGHVFVKPQKIIPKQDENHLPFFK